MYTSSQIASLAGGKLSGSADIPVKHLLTDSRQLTEPAASLFIALVTGRNDAHQYIFALSQKGVKTFLVNHIPDNCRDLEDVCFITVPDTGKALQQIAAGHRAAYSLPVIGITGSNGKTIVKEWLYQLLKTDYTICRSPKSYNSQVGVPLSVWQLNEKHNLGIFEAGISQPGEMDELEKVIKPSIGILTSLGSAHDEGFANQDQKLLEKLKLFKESSKVIVNAMGFNQQQLHLLPAHHLFLISSQPQADLQILETELNQDHTTITAIYKAEACKLTIPFTDTASISNVITCWATLLYLGISQDIIQQRVKDLQSVAMRLELKLGNNNCVLINDFYNSDINALEIALHHLKQQNRGGKKVVILSDIEQSGKLSWELYSHVSALMQQFEIDLLIGIGSEISSQKQLFTVPSFFFTDTDAFIKESKKNPELQFQYATILLKGARSFGFESISQYLQQKSHDTVLEINLNHLVHNINFYRSQLNKTTKLMCMVKATGYGSGSSEIAFTLQHHHVDYLAVAYTDEGVELRKAGIHLPIMVMSPEESSYDDMITHKLEPEVFSFKIAYDFLQALQSRAISEPYPVHIKLDTGMHRLGFENGELDELCSLLKHETAFKVKSIFSHLVASDNPAFDDFTLTQIALFEKMAGRIESVLDYKPMWHICNSGAITRFKPAQYDMVRLGIGMYGVGFNELEKQQLKNISSLKTKISQIKHLKPGDTVGYNRRGGISAATTIATIPIGYADGFSRKLGNGNFSVWINGKACKTIGNICMDMCMVDVTGINCREGDEVVIFESLQQLMELSAVMETIPYEVLTSISGRVKRVYVQE